MVTSYFVKGFEGYTISENGVVYSLKTRRYLKGELDKDGYNIVTLYNNGPFKKRVHRLVAQAFLDNPEMLPQVNHKDGIRNNNVKTNLEWTTAQDNVKHSYDVLGRVPWNKGTQCDNSHMVFFGKEHPKHVGLWITPYGVFETLRAAASVCKVDHKTVRRRCRNVTQGWGIIKL